MDNIEQATKGVVQAALCYTLTTPDPSRPMVQDYAVQGDANTATSQHKMLDTKVINEASAMDPTVKELKQLVEGGVREDARDWSCELREYFMKHAYYKMIDSTALIDGKGIILEGLRNPMLSALHRSHKGVKSMKARARDAMFWPTMNADIQRRTQDVPTDRPQQGSHPAQADSRHRYRPSPGVQSGLQRGARQRPPAAVSHASQPMVQDYAQLRRAAPKLR